MNTPKTYKIYIYIYIVKRSKAFEMPANNSWNLERHSNTQNHTNIETHYTQQKECTDSKNKYSSGFYVQLGKDTNRPETIG